MRRTSPLVPVFAAVLATGASLWASPQATGRSTGQQQPPTFRSRVDLVPLTVVVVDRKGVPIAGLTKSDFTVLEDGQPREIQAFFPQQFSPQPPPAGEPVVLNRREPAGIAPQTRRTFVIILGFGRIQYPTKAIDGVRDFVEHRLLPQDLVAVIAFNRATDFTTDHAAILRFLDRYKAANEKVEWDIEQYWVHNVYEPLSEALQRAVDDVFLGPEAASSGPDATRRDGSVRDATALLLGMADPVPRVEKPWEARVTLGDLQEMARWSKWGLSDLMVRSSTLKVYAGIEYLRHLDGQKNLVFLGPFLGLASKDEEARLARRANDAGVTFNAIGTGGVPAHNVSASQNARNFAMLSQIQSMQHVTALTGGDYTGVSYADQALGEIDAISRTAYIIGYEPSNPERDGRYRNVEVKVNRSNTTARYRTGYYATDDVEPLALAEIVTQSRMETALVADISAGDIRLQGDATYERRGGELGSVVVTLRIDSTNVAFAQHGLVQSARIGVTLTGLNGRGDSLGSTTGRVSIDANSTTFLEYRSAGIPFTRRFDVIARPANVKVSVYDYGSDRIGTIVLPIK